MKTVLTIAGSDSSAGAGIQADLKTFFARGVYGVSVVTALTAQNTVGIQGIFNVPANFVALQIDSIMSDIGARVWKTGMLSSKEVINVLADKVDQYKVESLILDPVMVAKSGDKLLKADAYDVLISKLIPKTYVVTPNIFEAEILSGISIKNIRDVKKAAYKIYCLGAKNVVIKGGHLNNSFFAVDMLFDGKDYFTYSAKRTVSTKTHGTGCTFASVIAAELAKKDDLKKALSIAKRYITQAIKAGKNLDIGQGFSLLNHDVDLKKII